MAAFTTALTLGLLAGGTALSVKGQLDAGKAAKREGEAGRRAAESEAQLMEYNAAVADLQAKDAVQRGELEANRFRAAARAMGGEQRTGFAAGNVDTNYGSAVDVQADTAFLGELDALTARTNAARTAWGFNVEATDMRKRADIARKEGINLEEAGKQRQSAAKWGAVGTVVGAGSSYLQSRYGFGRNQKPAAAGAH
jgi:hypothetical protein